MEPVYLVNAKSVFLKRKDELLRSGVSEEVYQESLNLLYEGFDSEDYKKLLDLIGYIIPDKVTPEELIVYLKILFRDFKKGKCGFLNSSSFEQTFNEIVNIDIDKWFSYIPDFIFKAAPTQFSEEFIRLFKLSFYGIGDCEEVGYHYSCVEVKPDFIDISNKDKAEVLAALYNHAKPVGMGVSTYNPRPMSIEEARAILEKNGTSFGYLGGRPLKINLEESPVCVSRYNSDNNCVGLAQKAISSCRDITPITDGKRISLKDDKEKK